MKSRACVLQMCVAQVQACNSPHRLMTARNMVSRERMAKGEQETHTRGWCARFLPRVPSPCTLPGYRGCCPSAGTCVCCRRVHRQHRAARQLTTPPTHRASRGVGGRDRDPGARRHTARPGALGLDERDELALGLRVALDVALRHRQAGMPREFLDVPETPADLRDFTGSAGNEGPAPGMRRTAVPLQRRIQAMEPQAHGR